MTDPDAGAAVVAPLTCSLIGEERTVTCVPGTRLAAICGLEPFAGFHWCSYGLAPAFEAALAAAGVVVCARAPDAGVEGIELPAHPFFVATLFQPQVGALAGEPLHPLIGAFLEAVRAPVARQQRALEPVEQRLEPGLECALARAEDGTRGRPGKVRERAPGRCSAAPPGRPAA